MEPNFHDKQYLIIDELSYRFNAPQRGDVVVIRYPNDPKQYFLKRLIGLPKETVKLKDGRVYIYNEEKPQGFVLNESYLPDGLDTYGINEVVLGKNEYFVLGDNRAFSLDSRSFGALDEHLIIGKVWIRGWPLSKIGVIPSVKY